MSNQPIEFPRIPETKESKKLLKPLCDLSFDIMKGIGPNASPHLARTAALLYILGDAPFNNDYVYFRLYEGLKKRLDSLRDYYNHYIHSRGQEYMLSLINQEIGEFEEFFNPFQFILKDINEKAKVDTRYNPINILLWGFFCSMFERKKFEKLVDEAFDVLEKVSSEFEDGKN
jgi:hypothetical protein